VTGFSEKPKGDALQAMKVRHISVPTTPPHTPTTVQHSPNALGMPPPLSQPPPPTPDTHISRARERVALSM